MQISISKLKDLELENKAKSLECEELKIQLKNTKNVEYAFSADIRNPLLAGENTSLKAELNTIKKEQAELYKTNATNSQRVLSLLDNTQAQASRISSLEQSVFELKKQSDMKQVKIEDLQDLVNEKNNIIQILKDELSAHQLELIQREEQLTEAIKKLKEVEDENKTLLERWMKLKAQEATKMNEANEFVETALKTKATLFPGTSLLNVFRKVDHSNSISERKNSTEEETNIYKSILPKKSVLKFSGHEAELTCIQISPNGMFLATGSNDKNVILWNPKTGIQESVYTGANQTINCVSFNKSSEQILATSNDNSIKIWDIASNRLRHTLTGHLAKITSASFVGTHQVISGSHDRIIRVWDLVKGFCTKTIFTLSSCNDLVSLDTEGFSFFYNH